LGGKEEGNLKKRGGAGKDANQKILVKEISHRSAERGIRRKKKPVPGCKRKKKPQETSEQSNSIAKRGERETYPPEGKTKKGQKGIKDVGRNSHESGK